MSARSGAASSTISSSRLPVVGSSGTTTASIFDSASARITKSGTLPSISPTQAPGADAQRVQLLRAPVDAVKQPAPGQVRVPIDQSFAAAAFEATFESHS